MVSDHDAISELAADPADLEQPEHVGADHHLHEREYLMRFSDPRPGYCSVCYEAKPETRFVDFEVAFDGQPVLRDDASGIRIAQIDGYQSSHDDLHICETCLRSALELLELKPEQARARLREIERLSIERDHWRATAGRFKAELDKQLAATLEPPRPVRRKVSV